MNIRRRSLLSIAALGIAAPTLVRAEDTHETERSLGSPDAKNTTIECFSLTCTHCAAFSRETMPQVQKELIDTGRLRWVFYDFPLDQVALTAAMVARYLPPDRYEPFINALFASQDRWAFARGVNSTDELWKMAALAGMSRATFDKAVADKGLRTWILQRQQEAENRWHVDSTPTFIINGQPHAGEMSFDAFRKLIPQS